MCKYRFWNKERCEEPALSNKDFCVLHLPLPKDEESDEFKRLNELKAQKVIEKRAKGDFNFEGAHLLEVDFTGITIKSGEGSHPYVNFGDAVIRRSAMFKDALIAVPISFEGAQIGEQVVFEGAQLGGRLWFRGMHIGGDAHFEGAVLDKDAQFEVVEIGGNAWFEGAKIGGDAYFEKAEIAGKGWFERAEIGGDAVFERSKIGKDAWFARARIGGDLWLDEARIGGSAWFENAEIAGSLVRLYHLRVNGTLTFRNTVFRNPKAQEEACRAAKRICEAMDNREDADNHFYREMTARRTIRLQNASRSKGFEKIGSVFELTGVFIEWLLADLTCKYGSDWKRPIYLWLIVILLSAFVYWAFGGIISAHGSVPTSFADALYFSFVTITTLGYGDYYPKAGFFQILVEFEAVFGVFMWAVLIAVFARKYMR